MSFITLVDQAVSFFRDAQNILFITGAGLSADSGLPTYRGVSGLYEQKNTADGIAIEVALSGSMFARRPEITWKYLAQIGMAAMGKSFNRGHEVIAEIEARWPRVWTLTQNIDGFHLQAGSKNVIEIHGSMHRLLCLGCGAKTSPDNFQAISLPPYCHCGSLIRPDVVLFGEMLPLAAVQTLERELRKGFDLVVSIGTSSVFPYILEPVWQAYRAQIPTIEINPAQTTEISKFVDIHLQERAAVVLDEIYRRLSA